MKVRPFFRPLVLLPWLWLAGCSDAVTGPEEVAVIESDLVLFLAEATGASAATANPERIKAAVVHAQSVLQRAKDFLQTQQGISQDVRALLVQADRACARAEASLEGGNANTTLRAAITCANLAREAVFLARAERIATVQDRATAVISEAQRLVAAAAPLVKDSAPEGVKVQLAHAQRELTLAAEALEARRFAEAIARATRASVIAERIIRAFG